MRKFAFNLEIFDAIIIFFYALFFYLLFLGLTGLFKNYFIAAGIIVFAGFFLIFRKSIKPIGKEDLKRGFIIFLLMSIIFVGCLFLIGDFPVDALGSWLPLAREIVRQSRIPDLLTSTNTFFTSRPPFFPLLAGATFSFFGFKAATAFWIPILFSFLSAALLYKWWNFKKINGDYSYFIFILFLACPLVLNWGWTLNQDALIMFFFIAFFYYLDRYKVEGGGKNLILLLASCVLALASKETGLMLLIALFVFWLATPAKLLKLKWALLGFIPMYFWWFRNFLIFDNPVYPLLNSVFKGRFHSYSCCNFPMQNLFERFSPNILSIFIVILPLIIVAVYFLIKKREFEYLLMLGFMFLVSQFWTFLPTDNDIRYYYPFVGPLIIYFFGGMAQIKSRIFLSFIFFVSVWGLLSSPVIISLGSFIHSLESGLGFLLNLVKIVSGYELIAALALSLFFYFFLAKKESAKYLIFFIIGFFAVRTYVSQYLSWLNVWIPILISLVVILTWPFLQKIEKHRLFKLIFASIFLLIFFNTWGLNFIYFFKNKHFPYHYWQKNNFLTLVGNEIKKEENGNNNFFILGDDYGFLNWYYDLKEIDMISWTFQYVTNLKYRNDMSSAEIYSLLKTANVEYVLRSTEKNNWGHFFEKVNNDPAYFRPIVEQDGLTLWKMI